MVPRVGDDPEEVVVARPRRAGLLRLVAVDERARDAGRPRLVHHLAVVRQAHHEVVEEDRAELVADHVGAALV